MIDNNSKNTTVSCGIGFTGLLTIVFIDKYLTLFYEYEEKGYYIDTIFNLIKGEC